MLSETKRSLTERAPKPPSPQSRPLMVSRPHNETAAEYDNLAPDRIPMLSAGVQISSAINNVMADNRA